MDTAKRLDLIRARLNRPTAPGFKPAGLFCSSTGLSPVPRKPAGRAPLDATISRAYGVADLGYVPNIGKKPGWVSAPDREPEKPLVAPKKRRKGKHYLSEIVEKMPGKLPAILSTSPKPS